MYLGDTEYRHKDSSSYPQTNVVGYLRTKEYSYTYDYPWGEKHMYMYYLPRAEVTWCDCAYDVGFPAGDYELNYGVNDQYRNATGYGGVIDPDRTYSRNWYSEWSASRQVKVKEQKKDK